MDLPTGISVDTTNRQVLIAQANIIKKYYSEECLCLTLAIDEYINELMYEIRCIDDTVKQKRLRLTVQELMSANKDCRKLNRQLDTIIKNWSTPIELPSLNTDEIKVIIEHNLIELYVTVLCLHTQLEMKFGSSPVNESLIHVLSNDLLILSRML